MAQRKAQQRKQTQPRAKTAVKAVARPEPTSVDGWRQECERLRGELQAARAEIVAMRAREEDVLNRIDWVLDSLDSLGQIDT